MLYKVNSLSRIGLGTVTREFHIGDKELNKDVESVLEIQADGDELEAIREQFPSLVIPKHAVVRWYGDMAKFIVGNLKL